MARVLICYKLPINYQWGLPVIVFHEVSKQYDGVNALADINLEIGDSEFIFLTGKSGAGKSTLLKLIIREEQPTTGKVFVDDLEVSELPSSYIPTLRRKVATIFQDFKLLPQRTVFENVSFPLEILGLDDTQIRKTAEEILTLVGLEKKLNNFPYQLSGGEAQRTAIARAMVLRPEIILADEPTGNLDSGSAWEVMQLLGKLNSLGTTVVMATHNTDIFSSLPHRILVLDEGRIRAESKKPKTAANPKKK